MLRRKRISLCLLLIGVLACILPIWWLQHRHRPLPPLQIGFWYWHQPFHLSKDERNQLKRSGVEEIYVRAGTFTRNAAGVRLILPQEWTSRADGLAIHLVFNFDYSIVRNYAVMDNAAIASTVAQVACLQQDLARHAGIRIVGVQLDFDCATHSLPRYARMLRLLRSDLAHSCGPLQLSITALPTWFSSDKAQQVADAVDFIVPQYYEPTVSKSLDHYATISRLETVRRGMEEVASLGRPFSVGLPAYGHALMYDDRGSLIGLYRDMSLTQAARHPAFRLERAFAADADGNPAGKRLGIGENLVDLVAIRPAEDGKGRGYHLIYDVPTPELVAQHLALVRAERPPECRGVILFRYPGPDSSLTLPPSAMLAVLRGEHPRPDLSVRIRAVNTPWEVIETGERPTRPLTRIMITITNIGPADTFFAPDGIALTLRFDRAGLDEIIAQDFDGIETQYCGTKTDRSGLSAAPARADTIRARKFQLRAGETARLGPIRIPTDGATRVWGEWSLRDPDSGKVISGKITPKQIGIQEGR